MSESENKVIDEKIRELYNILMEKPLQVLEIFNNFFGEERVDMQEYLNLSKFSTFIGVNSMTTYLSDNFINCLNLRRYNISLNQPITALPYDQIIEILELLKRQDFIVPLGNILFNNIFILVHFPHVRVTNENNKYTDINHLWAKVPINYRGTIRDNFELNRSEYSLIHFMSNYLHSHICSIPKSDFTIFQRPCLGNGPITHTIHALGMDYNEDIWNLFCLELSKYVTVESLVGVPYKYLEHIGDTDRTNIISNISIIETLTNRDFDISESHSIIKDFTSFFIKSGKLKFNYIKGSYSIGMSLTEYITLISNSFISWYNNAFNNKKVHLSFERLLRRKIIEKCIINNNKIYLESSNNSNFSEYIGKKVCTFKGKDITLNIVNNDNSDNLNKSIILNHKIAFFILTICIKVLNYKYGREATNTETQSGTSTKYL